MGFFVISILLSPLALVMKQDFSGLHKIIPETYINSNWEEIEKRAADLNDTNQALLLDYYRKRIEEQVRELIKLEYPDFREDIQLTLDDNYGINSIKIILLDEAVEYIDIEPVKIDGRDSTGEESAGELYQYNYEREKLRYNLAQFFQISQDKIDIFFKAGGR
jgi:hypothetical protein